MNPFPAMNAHMAECERAYLRAVIIEAGGNVTLAAKIAEKNRTYFHELLQRHDIKVGARTFYAPQRRASGQIINRIIAINELGLMRKAPAAVAKSVTSPHRVTPN